MITVLIYIHYYQVYKGTSPHVTQYIQVAAWLSGNILALINVKYCTSLGGTVQPPQ